MKAKRKIKNKYKYKHRKGNWLFRKIFEEMGVLEAGTLAWFAERVVLACVLLASISFASGALFVLYGAQPIAESETYGVLSSKAAVATEQIIDFASPIFSKLLNDNREENIIIDQLAERKNKLMKYLAGKNSPFANDDQALDALVSSKNMRMIIAISFVESSFGKHCYYHNCSGIGGTPPNLRKYQSHADWVVDFDKLLENRYKNLPPEKFIGLYVQPGSPNWIYGVKQVLNEFEAQKIDS